MDELTSVAIRTKVILVKLLAESGLVPRRHMLLFLKFVIAVGKSTRLSILALAFLHPLFAKLCLDLQLIVLRQNSSVTFEGEGVMDSRIICLWSCPYCPRGKLSGQ